MSFDFIFGFSRAFDCRSRVKSIKVNTELRAFWAHYKISAATLLPLLDAAGLLNIFSCWLPISHEFNIEIEITFKYCSIIHVSERWAESLTLKNAIDYI